MVIMLASLTPMVQGIHMLLARVYGSKQSSACITFPHVVLLDPVHLDGKFPAKGREFTEGRAWGVVRTKATSIVMAGSVAVKLVWWMGGRKGKKYVSILYQSGWLYQPRDFPVPSKKNTGIRMC